MTQISDAPTATEVSGPSAYTAAAAPLPEGALRAAAVSGGAEWTAAAGWSRTTTAAAAVRRGKHNSFASSVSSFSPFLLRGIFEGYRNLR